MSLVGLVVNPAAGRDIRRLTGGASVVDNYAKRSTAACVLDGLTLVDDPPAVAVMPDRAGIADHVVDEAPDGIDAERIEMPVEQSAADTRRAAARFREIADAVVVLGGDGTTRDVAVEVGGTPLVAVSTGTNNVVPSAVDGTVAGGAAALVATGAVDSGNVTDRHGFVEARVDVPDDGRCVTGLASIEVTSRSFIGTRAMVDPSDLVGGVVTRARPGDVGLSSVAGCVEPFGPAQPGGAAVRLTDPEDAPRTVRSIVAPGMTTTVGIAAHERIAWNDPVTFDVEDGVVGADGERELELVDATVEITPVSDGPRLIDVHTVLETAADVGILIQGEMPVETD